MCSHKHNKIVGLCFKFREPKDQTPSSTFHKKYKVGKDSQKGFLFSDHIQSPSIRPGQQKDPDHDHLEVSEEFRYRLNMP